LADFFGALAASDVPRDARFVSYIDSNEPGLAEKVKGHLGQFRFSETKIEVSGRAAPPAESPRLRRPRHALMREASKYLVDDGPLLLLEDDTLIPPETFGPLSETKRRCDWAIGAEVGRWGRHRPPGVWRLQLHKGRPIRKEAVMPAAGTEEVDATGFYCVLTQGAIYRSMDFLTWNETLGHDVHCTWRLTQAGRRLMVDWRVECVHLGQEGPVYVRDATPYSVGLPGNVDIRLRRVDLGRPKGALRYPIAIGVDCELEGKRYAKGTHIDHETALALKATGQLKDERIC
jgi:hypothetical protein